MKGSVRTENGEVAKIYLPNRRAPFLIFDANDGKKSQFQFQSHQYHEQMIDGRV